MDIREDVEIIKDLIKENIMPTYFIDTKINWLFVVLVGKEEVGSRYSLEDVI